MINVGRLSTAPDVMVGKASVYKVVRTRDAGGRVMDGVEREATSRMGWMWMEMSLWERDQRSHPHPRGGGGESAAAPTQHDVVL